MANKINGMTKKKNGKKCVAAAAAACCLLLFVIVYRMAKIVAGSMNLIAVFSSSSFKHEFFNVPHGSTVAFTASICL